MADYLNKIAAAKADIAQFKGEKEAFEQSNAPDDADEEELANWNYARDLERQMRELKAEHKDALKELAKLERAAVKARATEADRQAAAEAKTALQPVFDRLASIETELVPYECTKAQLAEARARYRELTNTFVDELKSRCAVMSEDEKRALVLELVVQDAQTGLNAAVGEKRQELVQFLETLLDNYRLSLDELQRGRSLTQQSLSQMLERLRYV